MKKDIHTIAIESGFTDKRTAEIDIIIAEMASNLVKHGGGGEILVKTLDDCDAAGIEIICIDNGRGMQEPHKMMVDGVSSTNTLGHGLGSISRLSDTFQIYSIKEWGTIILSRVYKEKKIKVAPQANYEVRMLMVSKPGETVCGDGAHVSCNKKNIRLFLGDGLGHGADAQKAVAEAVRSFIASGDSDPVDTIRSMNYAVKRTRGLVAAIAIYNAEARKWQICGVGNISTRMFHSLASKNYMAYNGIVGLNVPGTMKTQEIAAENGQVLIMCSDGIRSKWDISKYTGILKYDLSILAATIYKDHARRTDDMSVVVCRLNKNV